MNNATDELAPGYVPGHIMAITSPPANPPDPDECLWWPVPSCTCGWRGDDEPTEDAATAAHAQHLLLAAPMCERHPDRIAVHVGGGVRLCHEDMRAGVDRLIEQSRAGLL